MQFVFVRKDGVEPFWSARWEFFESQEAAEAYMKQSGGTFTVVTKSRDEMHADLIHELANLDHKDLLDVAVCYYRQALIGYQKERLLRNYTDNYLDNLDARKAPTGSTKKEF